ncbi:hypothetical protein XENOCAPTIV_022973 [Xenoophorus captivus]|uniref:Secreted protein n=1 Tax=Xenoophorus captivus TaxID=1517983 RepID=A0ABV0R5U8_9TELE
MCRVCVCVCVCGGGACIVGITVHECVSCASCTCLCFVCDENRQNEEETGCFFVDIFLVTTATASSLHPALSFYLVYSSLISFPMFLLHSVDFPLSAQAFLCPAIFLI